MSEQTPREMEGSLFLEDEFEEDERPAPGQSAARGRPGDGKAEQASDMLASILARMDLDARVSVREDGERVVLDVTGADSGRAIGKKGQTLDALQFLINKIVNRFPQGRRHIVVDSGNYRERYDNGLISMAEREAKRALQLGRVIALEPMSARDRRVIHLSLAKVTGVSTRSDGEGFARRVQIIPSRVERGGTVQAEGSGRGGRGGGGGRGPGSGEREQRPAPAPNDDAAAPLLDDRDEN